MQTKLGNKKEITTSQQRDLLRKSKNRLSRFDAIVIDNQIKNQHESVGDMGEDSDG